MTRKAQRVPTERRRRPPSIEEPVRELKRMIGQRADAPLTARLASQPAAATPGTVVTFVATVFGDRGALSDLSPVLRSLQVTFTDWPMRKRVAPAHGSAEFVAEVRTKGFKPDSYHFTVHPTSGADAIALCALHLLTKDTFDAARKAPELVFGRLFRDVPDPKPSRGRGDGPRGRGAGNSRRATRRR